MPADRLPPLIAIVGPTASGKSSLAIELAERFDGEIVSADSRQVYRGMDIGTGKVNATEQAQVPHHLLDVADPAPLLTLAEYQRLAFAAIEDIRQRDRLPLLAGGTGLYVRAVVDNLQIPAVAPQVALRAELEQLSIEQLVERLRAADPDALAYIDTQNPRRLIRAIEVSETSGLPFSAQQATAAPKYDPLLIGLAPARSELEQSIRQRVDDWLARGLLDEITDLHTKAGLTWEQIEAFGLHYRLFAQHLQDALSYETARESAVTENLQYAKRQMTWFKRDARIQWITEPTQAAPLVASWLAKRTKVAA